MSVKNLFYFYQKPETTNDEYLKEFNAWVESIDDFDAYTLGKFPCLVKKKLEKTYNKTIETATQSEIDAYKKMVKKEVMAAVLLSGAAKIHYGRLKSTLAQHMSMRTNQYPHTVEETMNIFNT